MGERRAVSSVESVTGVARSWVSEAKSRDYSGTAGRIRHRAGDVSRGVRDARSRRSIVGLVLRGIVALVVVAAFLAQMARGECPVP
jgi:hypothetical protein